MRRALFALALLFLPLEFLRAQTSVLAGPKRYALVIANSSYRHLPRVLPAHNEAEAVAAALQTIQFEVTVLEDQPLLEAVRAIETGFLPKLTADDICLIYYTGHATQAVNENWLLPVDFDLARLKIAQDIDQNAFSLGFLEGKLRQRAGLKLILLEAPIKLENLFAKVAAQGLDTPDLQDAAETLVAFGAYSGQVTPLPQRDIVRPFTQAFISGLANPGVPLGEFFRSLQAAVLQQTGGVQRPFSLSTVTRSFYFRDPLPVTRKPRLGVSVPNRRDRQEYVWIPAGEFLMGCVPEDQLCEPDEKPQHKVTLTKGFWMGRNEVEVEAFERFVRANAATQRMPKDPSFWNKRWEKKSHPMANLTWDSAEAYCEWAGGRLPTEAEWEYAARANHPNDIYLVSAESAREQANFYGRRGNDVAKDAAQVRKYDSNAFGLFDMSGNVWEWCLDFYDPKFYSSSPATDPKGPATGKDHVLRGGSFDSDPKRHLRLSLRRHFSGPGNAVGFRCVLPDSPETDSLLQQ